MRGERHGKQTEVVWWAIGGGGEGARAAAPSVQNVSKIVQKGPQEAQVIFARLSKDAKAVQD